MLSIVHDVQCISTVHGTENIECDVQIKTTLEDQQLVSRHLLEKNLTQTE